MKTKDIFLKNKEKVKIIVIAILTFTLFMGIIFSNDQKVSRILDEKFFNFNFSSISKIETELEGTLTKTGKNWALEFHGQNLPADQKRIETFIKDLADLRKNKLVSSAPKKNENFGIKDTPNFKIFDTSGKLLTEIHVGKAEEGDSRLAYIKGNDSNVYLTNNIFLSYKGNSYNTFVDSSLFSEGNSKLSEINFKLVINSENKNENEIKNNYNVLLKDEFYYLNAEKLKNDKILNTITTYKTEGLEINKSKIQDYEMAYKIELKWNNNSINNLEVYLNKDNSKRDILIKKDLDDYYYMSNKWNFYDVFNLESKLKSETEALENGDINSHEGA